MTAFLLPAQLAKLVPQLKTMKPGARIVSHQFEIPGIVIQDTYRLKSVDDGETHVLYSWAAPLLPTSK